MRSREIVRRLFSLTCRMIAESDSRAPGRATDGAKRLVSSPGEKSRYLPSRPVEARISPAVVTRSVAGA